MADADEQAAFLGAARAAATDAGVDLVINARVGTYMNGTGTPSERLAESVRRGRLYLRAGADCVYPVFVSDAGAVRALAEEIDGLEAVGAHPAGLTESSRPDQAEHSRSIPVRGAVSGGRLRAIPRAGRWRRPGADRRDIPARCG
jgi:2-methylisocitrate lyase-like PEP mutase family enzyme